MDAASWSPSADYHYGSPRSPISPLFDAEPDSEPNTATANAVSFGFIAVAILISMFLIIAIFERLLGSRRSMGPLHPHTNRDMETAEISHQDPHGNKYEDGQAVDVCAKGVLMPGQKIPTTLACPVPLYGTKLQMKGEGCSTKEITQKSEV